MSSYKLKNKKEKKKMKFKKLKVLLGISLLVLGGCGNKGEVKTDNKVYKYK